MLTVNITQRLFVFKKMGEVQLHKKMFQIEKRVVFQCYIPRTRCEREKL